MEQTVATGAVIVTWNGRHHLQRLLPSLLAQRPCIPDIVIVDNGSHDGTRDWIAKHYPMIGLITFSENHGFAGPNNAGIAYLLQKKEIKYIACINNDTVLPVDFFSGIVSFAENSDLRIGAFQTKIVFFDDPSVIDSAGITIDLGMSAVNDGHGEKDIGKFDGPREIFGAAASAAVYSRSALEALFMHHGAYFDTDFFAYQEDVDLAFRMRLLGFTAWYVPGPPVLHVHSATGRSYSPFKSYHIHRNSLYMIIKNMPGFLLITGLASFIAKYGTLINSLKKERGPSYELSKKAGVPGMAGIVLKAWAVFLLHLPSLLTKRRRIQQSRVCGTRQVKSWFTEFRANRSKIIYGASIDRADPRA